MAPSPLFVKPCVVILTVAVAVSRLMSTNGRAVRLQQHQQPQFQRHHSTGLEDSISYNDPELDIDRLYELMNDNRATDRMQQLPHQQLLKARPPSPSAADAAPAIGSHTAAAAADSSHVTAVAGPTELSLHQPASATADRQQQHQQKPVNQSTAVHAAEPRYHFEVHSVQHTGHPFQTAEQKLRTVVRQAAAVEYHLKDVGDGRQTLIDDNEIHQKRLASIGRTRVQTDSGEKSSPKPDSGKAIAAAAAVAAEARYRIEQEQLRQLQEQEQRYYDEGELDDEEMQDPYEPEADLAAPEQQSSKVQDEEIDKRPKQQSDASKTVLTPTADGEDRRLPSSPREREADTGSSDDRDASQPWALPVKTDLSDRMSVQRSAGSASSIADIYFLAVVIGCAVAGIAGFMFAGLCWYRLHRKMKEAGDVDYPAYGVTGPVAHTGGGSSGIVSMPGGTAGSPGDRKLAQSAQMYHYQHQKQQMIASERLSSDVNQQAVGGTGSDVESEEENEDGDYTVFECPGLATNGEMEVRNPMFNDPTPVSTPADTAGLYGQTKK